MTASRVSRQAPPTQAPPRPQFSRRLPSDPRPDPQRPLPLTTDVRTAKPGLAGLPSPPAPQLPLLPAKACPPLPGSAKGRGRKSPRRLPRSRLSAAARWARPRRPLGAQGPAEPGRGRLCPRSRAGSEGKVCPGVAAWHRPRRSQVLIPRRGGLSRDPAHPVSTQPALDAPSPAASGALGVARLAAPAGGDRWRRVTMATRGVRRAPSLPPPPGVTHLRASPGRRRRRERRGGRRPGPEAAGSGWGGNARAAVSAWRRSSLRRASAHQSVSPSFLPRPLPARRPSAQPPADCGCQTVPSPSRRRQPIAALPRGAAGPRRAGRPGRCLRGKETRGRTLRARRGQDPPGPTGSGPALRGLAGPGGRAGVAMAEDPQPRRRPLAARDRGSRNSAPGIVVPQCSPLRIRMDS